MTSSGSAGVKPSMPTSGKLSGYSGVGAPTTAPTAESTAAQSAASGTSPANLEPLLTAIAIALQSLGWISWEYSEGHRRSHPTDACNLAALRQLAVRNLHRQDEKEPEAFVAVVEAGLDNTGRLRWYLECLDEEGLRVVLSKLETKLRG